MGGSKGRSIREHLRPRRSRSRKTAPAKPQRARGSYFSPRALPLADLVRGLRGTPAGANLTLADLEADLEAGFAPNPDGTIDLVAYVAWLLRRHGYGRSSGGAAL